MKLKITGQQRNIIFITILILTIFSVALTYKLGAGQNQGWKLDYIEFQKSLQLIAEEKYPEAAEILESLTSKADYADSYYVYWNYALCFYKQEKYQEAALHYQKVRELNPLIVNNDKYLVQYGTILYSTQQYRQAVGYLERAVAITADGELKNEADKLLKEITQSKVG